MRTVMSLLLLFFLPIMQGCGFVYEQHLTGNYYLIAVDTKDDMDVCYHQQSDDVLYTGITGASVHAVGDDDNFILVKAYRALKDSMGISLQRYDKNTTEYYIIPVNNKQEAWEAQENTFGPFNKGDFETKRKELGVSDDIVFKEL